MESDIKVVTESLKRFSIGEYVRFKEIEQVLPVCVEGYTGKLLDVGCGTCKFKPIAELTGYKYFGLDSNPPTVTSENIIRDNAEKLQLINSSSMDVVIASDIIEHLDSIVDFVNAAYRVLKTNGKLIIHVPNLNSKHILSEFPDNADHKIKGLTSEQLRSYLETRFGNASIIGTFTSYECLAWEISYLASQGKLQPSMLANLLTFDEITYQSLGFLGVARKCE